VTSLCTDVPRGNSCDGLQTKEPARFTVSSFDGAVEITVQNEMSRTASVRAAPVLTG